MAFLRGTKKLLVAVGLAGCGAAAAVVISGLHSRSDAFKTRAASLIQSPWIPGDSQQVGMLETATKWNFNWDKREPHNLVNHLKGSFKANENEQNSLNERLEKARSVATRHLILVRHGQYNLDGKTDELRTLTNIGREQANFAGLRLKDMAIPYTRIVQSTMTRATETASIIRKHLPEVPVTSCDFLREGAPIAPEPPIAHWKPEAKVFQDGARIEAAFRKYFHRADASQTKDSYEILVCHANVIRYFICRALQFPPEAWLRFSLHNGSITWIAIRPSGRVVVYSVGDFGHMPPSKTTTS